MPETKYYIGKVYLAKAKRLMDYGENPREFLQKLQKSNLSTSKAKDTVIGMDVRALYWIYMNDINRAEALVDQVLKSDGDDVLAMQIKGFIAYKKGRYRLARWFLQQVVKRDPNSYIAFNNLGVVYKRLGDDYRAMMNFNRALMVKPRCVVALLNRGEVLLEFANYTKARKLYKTVNKIFPNNFYALVGQGIVEMSYNQSSRAIKYFRKALEQRPKFYELYRLIGECYERLKRYSDAIRYYQMYVNKVNPPENSVIRKRIIILNKKIFSKG